MDRIILATPRTEVLEGSVEAGKRTYVTRSQWMGFPDYTTVMQNEDVLELHARLRFGQSDLGVNKARVEDWLAQLASAESCSAGSESARSPVSRNLTRATAYRSIHLRWNCAT